jgi:putative transposase
LRAELKELVRGLLEALMRVERAMYFETHPTSANGYYTRDLLTLVGPVEDLKVPRVREGDFHPRILTYRKRASLELSEIIFALYAVGVSTGKISHFLERIYGVFIHPKASLGSSKLPKRK